MRNINILLGEPQECRTQLLDRLRLAEAVLVQQLVAASAARTAGRQAGRRQLHAQFMHTPGRHHDRAAAFGYFAGFVITAKRAENAAQADAGFREQAGIERAVGSDAKAVAACTEGI